MAESRARKPDEGSKFDRIFAKGTPDALPEPAVKSTLEPPQRATEPERAEEQRTEQGRASRTIGRPPGKRSDPAWKQFSVLLKRETRREAADILRSKDEGLDLSGLIQTLLEGWIKKQH